MWGRPLVLPGFGFECSFASFGLSSRTPALPDPSAPSDAPGMWLSPDLASPLLPAISGLVQRASSLPETETETGFGAGTGAGGPRSDLVTGAAEATPPLLNREWGGSAEVAAAAAKVSTKIAEEYLHWQRVHDQASNEDSNGSSKCSNNRNGFNSDVLSVGNSSETGNRREPVATGLWGWKFCVSVSNRQELFNAYASIGPSHCCGPTNVSPLFPDRIAASAAHKHQSDVYGVLTHSFSPVLSVALLQWLISDFAQHPDVIAAARKNPQVGAALGVEAATVAAAETGESNNSLAFVPAAAYDPALFVALLGAADVMAAVSPLPLQSSALAVARNFAEVGWRN